MHDNSFNENKKEMQGDLVNNNAFLLRLKSDKQHQLSHIDSRAWHNWAKLVFLSRVRTP